ncbi:7-carboxy-7-deazaguanine synthase QueE [Micromonospora sp. NPDC005305]|uniref:7-carboxy-7-deazaguanine synthase QueE n=1 Tax=Micromonospora sp. NPDC005305 TaxID=3156875 RepID=UPI0033A56F6C
MPHGSGTRCQRNFRSYLAVQGEGRSLGRRCAFLRLGGCNLSCRWCDTPYTWDWTGASDSGVPFDPKAELHRMAVATVLDRLLACDVDLVVISGGEPLNQQVRLLPLVTELVERGIDVEVETNGTRAPDAGLVALGVRFNVSPKLAHAGDPEEKRIVPAALRRLAAVPDTSFKFVCRDVADLEEVSAVVKVAGAGSVYVMPEGQSREEIDSRLPDLAEAAIRRGWNVTTRLHTMIWGKTRGV